MNGEKKNVGILTFQWADNYGGLLQCYALSSYLYENGYETEIINYWPIYALRSRASKLGSRVVERDFGIIVKASRKSWVKKLLLGRLAYSREKCKSMDTFRSKYLRLGEKKILKSEDLEEYIHFFDFLIAGSDQIWNPGLTGGRYDCNYFLSFKESNAIKIAYAASMGVPLLEEKSIEFHALLSNFDYISTRERSLAREINKFDNCFAVSVLDPVFLLDQNDWKKISYNGIDADEYILLYVLQRNDEILHFANWLQKKTGYKLIVIGAKRAYKKAEYKYACSVNEFLWLFDNAKYIITNSFHGTAFSVIFQKQFITFLDSKKPDRMRDLLEELGLCSRLSSANSKQEIFNRIDYESVNNKLSKKIDDSKCYLLESLKE